MRPQQQNRRMRSRNNGGAGGNNNSNNNNNNNSNNNNRKGPNPLTRNYESNGPDVKIRGSAQQIAEKYTTLARDATSSGDRVMAENYLQHAEHYNRIIAAAQAQFAAQQVNPVRDDMDDDMDEGSYSFEANGSHAEPAQQQPAQTYTPAPQMHQINGSGPQPVIDGMPAEVALNTTAPSQPSGGRQQRERRPHRQPAVNGAADAPSDGAPAADAQTAELPFPPVALAPAEAPLADGGEERQAPRRGRRPRRNRDGEAPEASAGDGQLPSFAAVPESDNAQNGGEKPVRETVQD